MNKNIEEKIKEKVSEKKIIKEIYWVKVEFWYEWIRIWETFMKNNSFDSSFNRLSMAYLSKEIIEMNLWDWNVNIYFLYFIYDMTKSIPSIYDLMMVENLYFLFTFDNDIYKFEDWNFDLIWNMNEMIKEWKTEFKEVLWTEEIEIKISWNKLITSKFWFNEKRKDIKEHKIN